MEEGKMSSQLTALSTSLAIPLYPRGLQILMAMAVYECMRTQYYEKK